MFELAWPWIWLLLPLPWLVRRLVAPCRRTRSAALRVPFAAELSGDRSVIGAKTRRGAPLPLVVALLAWFCWLLLLAAASRPQWLGEAQEVAISGRDLLLAVDLSASMQEQDFELGGSRVDRLTASKWVAGQFIERRAGDRLGLILFGEQAYLQTPLTFDRKTVVELLNESAIGLAGKNTAIGDAIGLAIKRLGDAASSRVLILMTDGANTAGAVQPLDAARHAAERGLKIYTIGIGADRMVVNSLFGRQVVNPSRDLDEATLGQVAELTGGRYFRARDMAALEEIYALLDELEPVVKEKQLFRPVDEWFPWPLGLALVAFCGLLLVSRERVSD